MSLRAALLDILADPAQLQTLATGAATDAEFASRVIRAAGATWVEETEHEEELLLELERANWRFGGLAPGGVFIGPGVTCGLLGAVSQDRSWVNAYDLRIAATNYRPFRQPVGGLKIWKAPG